ncbi:MAG TPA: hypothetical protein PLN32_07300 [Methanoregulaceae archaeon]|nr:hypothetical protein [Methanoregulaceae archaeon]
MTTKSWVDLLVITAVILVIGTLVVSAADPVPASSGTSSLLLIISADASGNLLSDSELQLTQGTTNLSDNPPLDQGEGQAAIGYDEKTLATSGSITYTRTINLDTSSQSANGANLETVRQIDYANGGDGDGVGTMYSRESVLIEVERIDNQDEPAGACPAEGSGEPCPTCSAAVSDDGSPASQLYNPYCVFSDPVDDDDEPLDDDTEILDDDDEDDSENGDESPAFSDTTAASSVRVIAGSEVQLSEGSVNSASSSRTIADNPEAGVEASYSVNIDGSGHSGDDRAEGKAEVFTDAFVMEGYGTNETTEVGYEQQVMAQGLIEISMETGYSSP